MLFIGIGVPWTVDGPEKQLWVALKFFMHPIFLGLIYLQSIEKVTVVQSNSNFKCTFNARVKRCHISPFYTH